MTLPSYPPSGGTRLHHRSSFPWWKLHAKRFAMHYLVLIALLFLWSANHLKLSLQQDYQDQQPVTRVRANKSIQKKKKQGDLMSKLPPWNAKQHPSASISLTGAYKYRDEDCQSSFQHCEGRLFFPAVDLKQALPYDEAMDMFKGIVRNSTVSSVTKNLAPLYQTHAVLTRGGNKDFTSTGSVTANQDRVLLLQQHPNSAVYEERHDFIMALLDGHGTNGHEVSHHAALTLGPVLHKQLRIHKQQPQVALTNTFLEIDDTIPPSVNTGSGSTAIVLLRLKNTLHIANTGDSLAFVASYDTSTGATQIIFQTQPHKPHLPEERARIEAAGGEVVPPQGPGDSSRVVIPLQDASGTVMALAMSRSIGDKEGASLGVIPNPTIDELDLNKLNVDKHKHLFAVAASDGLFDRVTEQQVAESLAKSLFGSNTISPLEACEELIMKSSYAWIEGGMPYRDDISIATTVLVRDE